MFLRREHIEMLRAVSGGSGEATLASRSSRAREHVLELLADGLLQFKSGKIELTDAGRTLVDVFAGVDISTFPDVIANSAAIEALELYEKTGMIPEEWKKFLERRGLWADGPTDVAKAILEAYRTAQPALILTNDIVSFLFSVPAVGLYDDLVDFVDLGGYSKETVALLQAMRLLKISPPTDGASSYVITPAAKMLLATLSAFPKVYMQLYVGAEEAEALEKGIELASLVSSGLQSAGGGITEYGRQILSVYRALRGRHTPVPPIFLDEAEHAVLRAIKEILRINKDTPAIVPEYSEIKRRLEKMGATVEHLGEVLAHLESKGFVERREEKGKTIYQLTEYGSRAVGYGPVSVNAMKAIAYALAGELPLPAWVREAREFGVLATGITDKGEFYGEVAKHRTFLPFLTGYDAAVLLAVPRKKYVSAEYVYNRVLEFTEEPGIENFENVLGFAESKDLIRVLPNGAVSLTERGDAVKSAVESAKTRELTHVRVAVTPLALSILRRMVEDAEEVNKIWKKAYDKKKDFYEELAKWLAKSVRAPVEEVIKELKLLHKLGFIGEKSATDAGKQLVAAYS